VSTDIKIISAGTADYERGAKIRPYLYGISVEAFKKKGESPETTTSLV
jgi:hypothetical protein